MVDLLVDVLKQDLPVTVDLDGVGEFVEGLFVSMQVEEGAAELDVREAEGGVDGFTMQSSKGNSFLNHYQVTLYYL